MFAAVDFANDTLRDPTAFNAHVQQQIAVGARCILITADPIPPSAGEIEHVNAFAFLGGTEL